MAALIIFGPPVAALLFIILGELKYRQVMRLAEADEAAEKEARRRIARMNCRPAGREALRNTAAGGPDAE